MSFLFLLVGALLFLSALSSASETALFSLSSLKVKTFKQDADPRRRLIAELLAKPRDLLVTIIMLNISINIMIQNLFSSIFGDYAGWGVNVGIPLVLILIFGDALPKSLGMVRNVAIATRMAPLVAFCQKVLYPVRRVVVSITNGISRFLFFFLKKEPDISIDELQHALRTSKDFGVVGTEEAELVRGYLFLQESSVKEKMRPREEVLFFSLEEPLSRLIHLFVDQECSRIPICREGLDEIVGIMTSRLFFLHRARLNTTADLPSIVARPFFVPESIPAKVLLRQFYSRKESLALVIDEYSSVSGLITLEDLVETVVGEIADRRDEKGTYTRSGEDVIIASGKMELSELEEIFDIPLPTKNNMVTVGGYLTELMDDIPKSGSKVTTSHFLFHVLAADPTRVRRVYIRRLKKR